MITPYWHYAKNRSHKSVVLFIHHFGGDHNTSARHVRLMNSLGFDCVTFTLPLNLSPGFTFFEFLSLHFKALCTKGGISSAWETCAEQVLTSINRPVILYSLSSTSICAIGLILKNPKKITAWVCDGGPFLELKGSFKRYYTQIHGLLNPLQLKAIRGASYLAWHEWSLLQKAPEGLKRIPKHLPILSIRGSKDPLVLAKDIENVFLNNTQLNLSLFEIKNGGHLDGLSKYSSIYKQKIKEFSINII